MSWVRLIDIDEPVVIWLGALGSIYAIYKVLSAYLATPSAAYVLRGPDSPSWLFGNDHHMRMYRNETLARWLQEYGTTFAIHGFFGSRDLLITDTKAAAFIINRPADFPKHNLMMRISKKVFGDGLLAAEDLEHKKQRKVLNPAFSVAAMRDISPMIMQVAHEMRDQWKIKLSKSTYGPSCQEIDVLDWAHKAALDMIGIAGFGYKFNSLYHSSNELARAFNELSTNLKVFSFAGLLNMLFPILTHLPTKSNLATKRSMAIMRRIGSKMIVEKKAEANQLRESSSGLRKDLLSLLIRANMKENAAEALDDETLLAQISTFLLAGHETTATAVSWGLYALAKDPNMQKKLRDEVLAVHNDSPSMDELNALPYLSNFVKETLRLTPPIVAVKRVAREDTFVPLSQPIINKHGDEVHELFIRRGEGVYSHMYAMNVRFDLWGPDALEFKPERFDKLPEAVSDTPSMFANISSFSAGPKGCIGWRMAVLEFKAILFTMVRTFEFRIDPTLEISGQFVIAIKPSVKGQEEKGPQLPLLVSLL